MNARITAAFHGYTAGNSVYLTGIAGELGALLNGRTWKVVAVIDAANFTIDADTTGLATFTAAEGERRAPRRPIPIRPRRWFPNLFPIPRRPSLRRVGIGLGPRQDGDSIMGVARVYQVGSPYNGVELAELDFEQTADTMYIAHIDHAPESSCARRIPSGNSSPSPSGLRCLRRPAAMP